MAGPDLLGDELWGLNRRRLSLFFANLQAQNDRFAHVRESLFPGVTFGNAAGERRTNCGEAAVNFGSEDDCKLHNS